ncbi:MAG: hypothetical protein JRD68_16135 [Deltaproteobacteria bacterium]|nr:hypothetical protein [Deltaproteobacteria bacterium]
MKIPGIRYLLFTALMVIIFSSCSRNIKEITINNLNAPHKIVIASNGSDFRDSIRDKVIKKYSDNCYIEVINLDKLQTVEYDRYDVILVMDAIIAWGGFNPEMKNYIDSLSDKKKVVLFLSAGDEELKYSYNGVDAISSASVVEEEGKAVKEITGKIDILLSEDRPD